MRIINWTMESPTNPKCVFYIANKALNSANSCDAESYIASRQRNDVKLNYLSIL